jgi:hypothetical protein
MSGITEAEFYERIADAPNAAKGFFESIKLHFGRRNDVVVHHTKARGGDLRLALPKGMYYENMIRKFATMDWQKSDNTVFARTILTPEESAQLGFAGATVPTNDKEPLNSDLILGENVWRNGAGDFIKALEAAKFKMLSERGLAE